MPLSKEIWMPIIGYEGKYEVSTSTRVRSCKRKVATGNGGWRITQNKIMKPFWNKKDQLCIFLYKNGAYKIKLVYRLMAQVFLKNPYNKPTVNHKDANRRNNKLSNLEWATYSEQMVHSMSMGIHDPTRNLPKNKKNVK